MHDLATIKETNLRALLREAFAEHRSRDVVRLLTPDDYVLLESNVDKARRRDVWLKHKRESKARFWRGR